jgi:hypothetical protein
MNARRLARNSPVAATTAAAMFLLPQRTLTGFALALLAVVLVFVFCDLAANRPSHKSYHETLEGILR